MSISVSNSVMNYARSLEGTSLNRYSALSPMVLRSKAGKSNIVTNSSAKSNKGENGNIEKARNNSGTVSSNTEKKVFKTNSEIFYNNYFNTNDDTSFEIDGIAFSAEEIDAVRSVVQNAVSPLLGGKLYYDYKDYAQMGIAESSVAKYAEENLTEEQADVVNKSLSGYISSLLDKEEEWINSECYIDDTEGVGDTGEMNTYYGVRQYTPQWIRDDLAAVLAKATAAAAKYKVNGQGSGSKAVSGNHSAEGRSGGLIYCASNKELAGSVRSLFAKTDITDANQLADAFKEYKDMMTVAYRAVGFGRTTNDMLKDDTNSFTKQISNMKAVFSGINRNGVDSMF